MKICLNGMELRRKYLRLFRKLSFQELLRRGMKKVSINIAPTALDLSLCEFSLSTKLRWPLIKAKINPHKLQRGNMPEMFQSFVILLNSASADLPQGRGEGSLRNGNLFQSDRGHRLAVYLSDLWCYGSPREISKYILIFRVFRQN